MHEPGVTDPRTIFELNRPGRLIEALETCMARRVAPLRSGWSATAHLGRDLERHYGVRAPRPAIERALRVLARRGRIDLRAGSDGALWFRLRG